MELVLIAIMAAAVTTSSVAAEPSRRLLQNREYPCHPVLNKNVRSFYSVTLMPLKRCTRLKLLNGVLYSWLAA
jgi:hypothetical protein